MKKLFGLFLLAAAWLAPAPAWSAPCFWVGGTGDINDTAHWASASGGTTGTCAAAGGWPNSTADTATFDASSGGGTVTRNVNWTVGVLTTSAFTGTFGNSGDTATVNFNNWTDSGSGTRTVNMGASAWTCGTVGVAACTVSRTGATNLTFNSNTSTLVIAGSLTGAINICNLGAFTYNVVTFNADAVGRRGSNCNTGNTTIGTLNIAAPNNITLNNGITFTVTTLNFTGGTPSLSAFTAIMSSTVGSTLSMPLANAATCDFCIFRGISVATTSITATNTIDLGQNTNISITAPTGGGGGGGRIIGG